MHSHALSMSNLSCIEPFGREGQAAKAAGASEKQALDLLVVEASAVAQGRAKSTAKVRRRPSWLRRRAHRPWRRRPRKRL